MATMTSGGLRQCLHEVKNKDTLYTARVANQSKTSLFHEQQIKSSYIWNDDYNLYTM